MIATAHRCSGTRTEAPVAAYPSAAYEISIRLIARAAIHSTTAVSSSNARTAKGRKAGEAGAPRA